MTDIFDNVPDKRQDKNTTSLKFKRDLIEFFGEDYKDKTCLEIGTHRGYTTKILSSLLMKAEAKDFKYFVFCFDNPQDLKDI